GEVECFTLQLEPQGRSGENIHTMFDKLAGISGNEKSGRCSFLEARSPGRRTNQGLTSSNRLDTFDFQACSDPKGRPHTPSPGIGDREIISSPTNPDARNISAEMVAKAAIHFKDDSRHCSTHRGPHVF